MVVVGWRLFSLSVAAALLGAADRLGSERRLGSNEHALRQRRPRSLPARREFRTLAIASRCSTAKWHPGEWKQFSRRSGIVATPDQMIYVGDSKSQSRAATAYVFGAEVGPKDPKK